MAAGFALFYFELHRMRKRLGQVTGAEPYLIAEAFCSVSAIRDLDDAHIMRSSQ